MNDRPMRVLLVEDNPGDARLVREMLSEAEGFAFEMEQAGSLVTALDALARGKFDVALTDLSLADSQGLETFSALQSHAPGVPVVVLTGLDSDWASTQAVKSGAQDYLVKGKLTADSLVRSLRYAVVRHSQPADRATENAKAAIIGVLGAKGGVGATTLACHFALELARQSGQKTLLADLDANSASAAFLLDVKSQYSLLDAARSLHRLDADYWKGVVIAAAEGIDYLQAPGAVHFGEEVASDRVRHALRFARGLYRWIVVDLGRASALALELIPEARDLYVVSGYELPSLYEATRLLRRLIELGVSREQIRLVVNRAPKAFFSSASDLQKALGLPIHAVIPDCSGEMNDAYAERRFLDRRLTVRKQAGQLAARCLGIAAPAPERPGFLRRLTRAETPAR